MEKPIKEQVANKLDLHFFELAEDVLSLDHFSATQRSCHFISLQAQKFGFCGANLPRMDKTIFTYGKLGIFPFD